MVIDDVLPMPVSMTTIASHPVAADFVRAGSLSQSAAGYAGTITAVRRNVGGGSETVDWASRRRRCWRCMGTRTSPC